MSKQDEPIPGKSFVGRWSQRKLKVKAEQKPATTQAVHVEETLPANDGLVDVTDDPQHQAVATVDEPGSVSDLLVEVETDITLAPPLDEDEEPLLTDEQMPDIATLDSKSDVSQFFNRGVSAELRKAALKHIFSLPIHNIRDGLNDYDEDYTHWEPLGDVVTSDMKFHERRKEKERLEKERLEKERLAAEEAERELEEETSHDEQPSSDEQETLSEDELVAEDEAPTADDEASTEDVDIKAVDSQTDLLTSNDEADSTSTDKNVTEHA